MVAGLEKSAKYEFKVFPPLDQFVIPYTGKEKGANKPPLQVTEALRMWREKGIKNFEVYHFLPHEFVQKENYPLWKERPQYWFWEQIQKGSLAEDSAKLSEMWIAIDNTQKPSYDSGRQMYENDPFSELLKGLREEGRIAVPKEYEHVPKASRFAINPKEELNNHVLPEIAEFLETSSFQAQVTLPREIEVNIIGNISHKEWGKTNTWEWLSDEFGDDYRLVGCGSENGGLGFVDFYWFNPRHDFVGFRPLVVFSPKA